MGKLIDLTGNEKIVIENAKKRIGMTKTMPSGLKATITNYRNSNNLTVRFENGVIIKKATYKQFIAGTIRCPMLYEPIENYIKCTNPNNDNMFLIDAEDFEKIKNKMWSLNDVGYIRTRNILLHRLIMDCPKNMQVDHKNGNTLDNRRCNLRICTQSENNRNTKKRRDNTSGYKGVSWNKNRKKWVAIISINSKHCALGYFTTKEEAYTVYCRAAKRLHGEFARLA